VTGRHILENEYGYKCFDIDISESWYQFITCVSILGKIIKIHVEDIENYDEFKEKFSELYGF
jgi:hypothetical protein